MGTTARFQFLVPTAEGMTFELCLRQGQIIIYSSTTPNPSSVQYIWRNTVTADVQYINPTCLTVFHEISGNFTNRQHKRQISTHMVSLYITLEGQDNLNIFTFNSSRGNGIFNYNYSCPNNTIIIIDCTGCVQNHIICDPNANCINTNGSFYCVCSSGYYGNGTICSPG